MSGRRISWGIAPYLAASLWPALVNADFHTVTFSNPPGVPTGHLPDTGGILISTSHNFQEAGVHAEAIWAPSTHVGFVQGHFHHLENGFETMHGFGDADAEGWHDVQGFYIQMVDGSPFSLRSIDFRLRLTLQTARILVTTDFDPSQPFGGQFVEYLVGRFTTFRTQSFTDFENVTQVFISSFLVDNTTEQIQIDNIVVWTEPPVVGACCRAEGDLCDLLTVEDCTVGGGTYLGDKSVCTDGEFCPTRTGACCSPDAILCDIRPPATCVLPDGVFAGLGTGCGIEIKCPATTGACCVDNGAACVDLLGPVCVGPDTFFRGEGTQCIEGADCPVPCDSDADCDDGDVCNAWEICNLGTGECGPGTTLDCDDHDACTVDGCDPVTGCFTNPRDCDDSNACTTDACDPVLGCKNDAIPCEDADVCNGVATCNPGTGECEPGTPLDCDDGNACSTDGCDALTGCFHEVRNCDDGDPCTREECDPYAGCLSLPICPPGWACLAGECSCFQPAGDYNGDGQLNLGDFAHAVSCLGGPGGGLLPNCDCADLNADGDIDFFDLADYLNGVSVP